MKFGGTSVGSSDRIRAAAARWVACLRPVVRRHWYQWFVLENAFRSGGAPDS